MREDNSGIKVYSIILRSTTGKLEFFPTTLLLRTRDVESSRSLNVKKIASVKYAAAAAAGEK